MFRPQSARHLGRLRGGIFDILPFIENERLPTNRNQAFAQGCELVVIDAREDPPRPGSYVKLSSSPGRPES